MKVHTDKITQDQLRDIALEAFGTESEAFVESAVERGSRKRARAFDVKIAAGHESPRSATWIEWGDWIVEFFKRDPEAIVGQYDGAHDFIVQTQRAADQRPQLERVDAQNAADHWSEEIFWSNQARQGVVKITRVRDEVDPALAQKEAALRHQGIDPESMTDDEIDGAFGIPVCPECSSEEVSRAAEGRTFVCGNCGARFDNPLLAAS